MGDITDLFSTVSKTKVTPTKGYNANFTTTSTSFVDATSLSVSVPNGSFYVIKGILGANSPSMTATLQVLLGASVVFTLTVTSGGGGGATAASDSLILQNTTGSTQTAKVQLKSDNVLNTASVQKMSIIQGTFMNSFQGWVAPTSIDFVGASADGIAQATYEGIAIADNVTTAVTWTGNKFSGSGISFGGGAIYVAWDFTGKLVVI